MPNTPARPGSHSAASNAPCAKPARLCASCFSSSASTADVYVTMCVPTTLPVRSLTTLNSLGCSAGRCARWFCPESAANGFGRRQGGAARLVHFLRVVNFAQCYIVAAELVHLSRQVLVEMKK